MANLQEEDDIVELSRRVEYRAKQLALATSNRNEAEIIFLKDIIKLSTRVQRLMQPETPGVAEMEKKLSDSASSRMDHIRSESRKIKELLSPDIYESTRQERSSLKCRK